MTAERAAWGGQLTGAEAQAAEDATRALNRLIRLHLLFLRNILVIVVSIMVLIIIIIVSIVLISTWQRLSSSPSRSEMTATCSPSSSAPCSLPASASSLMTGCEDGEG